VGGWGEEGLAVGTKGELVQYANKTCLAREAAPDPGSENGLRPWPIDLKLGATKRLMGLRKTIRLVLKSGPDPGSENAPRSWPVGIKWAMENITIHIQKHIKTKHGEGRGGPESGPFSVPASGYAFCSIKSIIAETWNYFSSPQTGTFSDTEKQHAF
jgi:hypothetical protein